MRSLVYYIATSIDGLIADEHGDASQFPVAPETLDHLFDAYPETCPTHFREALGVTASPRRFDTVIMGRRTFAPALEAGLSGGAYPHLRQIVVTHDDLVGSTGVEVMQGDIASQVAALRQEPGRDIWLCGGAELAGQLIDLIDEVQLKINPVLLGSGIGLFRGIGRARAFLPVSVESLPGGVTLATFRPDARPDALPDALPDASLPASPDAAPQ